jgi:hypothetical protein
MERGTSECVEEGAVGRRGEWAKGRRGEGAKGRTVSSNQRRKRSVRPYGTGPLGMPFQAINCLATFIESLRDKRYAPLIAFAPSPFRPFAHSPYFCGARLMVVISFG